MNIETIAPLKRCAIYTRKSCGPACKRDPVSGVIGV